MGVNLNPAPNRTSPRPEQVAKKNGWTRFPRISLGLRNSNDGRIADQESGESGGRSSTETEAGERTPRHSPWGVGVCPRSGRCEGSGVNGNVGDWREPVSMRVAGQIDIHGQIKGEEKTFTK